MEEIQMENCLVAQSGGPTSVINATLAGVIMGNQLNPIYDTVYGGLHGIEGILQEKFVDLTHMSEDENKVLRQTPSSALGSCRYKLKRENVADFEKLFTIFKKYNITCMFYIGGNDSMDTVYALSEYAKKNNIEGIQFVGCPKTVDNDLMMTDHCPGFASAAKVIATTQLHTWLDYNVYTRQEVFILETMGRDAGWLAASACVTGKVDLLVLPELPFDKEKFFAQVREIVASKNKCYIVISEGVKYADGTYLAAGESKNDLFGHAVLGGAGQTLKDMLLAAGVCERAKVQDMSTLQRCYAVSQSAVDVDESFRLGMSAHMRSMDKAFTGKMVGLVRVEGSEYDVEFKAFNASEVANHVKNFPKEWILDNYRGISDEAVAYIKPLIVGQPNILLDENGLPRYCAPFYHR